MMGTNVIPLPLKNEASEELTFHELANVLPLIEGEAFEELVRSIKENGQREPIIRFDGKILDGRNRYRACLAAGVVPRIEDLRPGVDPVAFVIDINVKRRHLTASQKAFVMARFATYQRGFPKSRVEIIEENDEAPIGASSMTISETAEVAGVSKRLMVRAKLVEREGTEEEKQAVTNGTASLDSVSNKIIARRSGETETEPEARAVSNSGSRIKAPDGMTVSEWCRQGMQLEETGMKVDEAAKHIGCAVLTYRQVRDLCLLFDRDDLRPEDKQTVADALEELNTTRRASAPYSRVRPIVEKIWGARGQRGRAETQRVEAFKNALIAIEATCQRVVELEVPHLSGDLVKEALSQIKDAISNLKVFRDNINKAYSNE